MFILTTAEQACKALAEAVKSAYGLDVNIYTGLDNVEKKAPAFIITCSEATEEFEGSGIWHINTSLECADIAADSVITNSFAKTMFAAFVDSNAKEALSTYTGLFVYGVYVEGTNTAVDQDAWLQVLRLDLVCGLTE